MIVIGYWSGYEIFVDLFDSRYIIDVQEGARGINIPVHVTYKPNLNTWKVFHKNTELNILEIRPL